MASVCSDTLQNWQDIEPILLAKAYRMGFSREDSRDIIQEAYIKAVYSRRYNQDKSSFIKWSIMIVKNICIDKIRYRMRRLSNKHVNIDGFEESLIVGHNFNTEKSIEENAICKALNNINPNYREIIELAFVKNLSSREIAAYKGIKIGTVKSLLFRAVGTFANQVKEILGESAPPNILNFKGRAASRLLSKRGNTQ